MKKTSQTKQALTLLQKVNPLNKNEEKEKFFFDANYNPQFEYEEDIKLEELVSYGKISDKYLTEAKRILESVIKKYGQESIFLQETEGKVLSRELAVPVIQQYLRDNKIEDRVELVFSTDFISRTSVRRVNNNFLLNIRLPIDYREDSLEGTLHHEIGSHIFRGLNEIEQPWSNQRHRFDLLPYAKTEEGIAAINTNIDRKFPYLWLYALYYYAVVQAQRMSFSELFKDLRQYIDDKERCWKICLRVKRGVRDTSTHYAFSKDQVYLEGVMQLKSWLVKNNYNLQYLYIGKIDIEDWKKVKSFYDSNTVQLPLFMKNLDLYKEKIKRVYQFNHL